jgi:hypothetical protein
MIVERRNPRKLRGLHGKSGNAMIVPESSFSCGLAIESIAQAIDD